MNPSSPPKEWGGAPDWVSPLLMGSLKTIEGDICAESELNKGTTFFIYLPAHTTETRDIAESIVPETITGHGTVLLVDDEPAVLDPSATLLEYLGFTVLKAINGSLALEIFQKDGERIDLVILDLIMPNMSGKELYYKAQEDRPAGESTDFQRIRPGRPSQRAELRTDAWVFYKNHTISICYRV